MGFRTFEVRPVLQFDDGTVSFYTRQEAEEYRANAGRGYVPIVWSLYGVDDGGLPEIIGDYVSLSAARTVANKIVADRGLPVITYR